MLLKKGIHLNIIHNINRPMNEMLLGFKSWLPLYMIGSITPYYFEKPIGKIFSHMHCTSGSVALVGECPKGQENNCKLYITTKKEELNYYKNKTDVLLANSKPLMVIYKENNKKDFQEFIHTEKSNKSNSIYKVANKLLEKNYKNIGFTICRDKWITISKNTKYRIHFVIYHPKLRAAIENFLTNLTEN